MKKIIYFNRKGYGPGWLVSRSGKLRGAAHLPDSADGGDDGIGLVRLDEVAAGGDDLLRIVRLLLG